MSATVSKDKVLLPEIVSESKDDKGYRFELRVPKELHYFEGHFDQAKILPGVVQVEWVSKFSHERFDIQGEFLRLEVLKFQNVIVPEDEVVLELGFLPEKNKVTFKFNVGEKSASSGRIVYGESSGV